MLRRDFIQKASAISASGFLLPNLLGGCISKTNQLAATGIQIYTIREALKKDFVGSMERVAALGYKNLELFSYEAGQYFGRSIREIKQITEDLGMQVRSAHVGTGLLNPTYVGSLTNNWKQVIEDAALLEQEYLVLAYLQADERKTIDDYKKICDLLNKCGEMAKNAGIQLAYHNHAFEFEVLEGIVPYDFMLEACDKGLVQFEMDMYWMKRAKKDPLTYFKQHSGRFPLWHVKDMSADEDQFFASVGDGIIDWKSIFGAAEQAGLSYYFVEQDQTRDDNPFEEIEESIQYLNKNIL